MDPGIRFSELLAYNDEESTRWRRFFDDNPSALELPCDIGKSETVRSFVAHIFLTELFFANMLEQGSRADLGKIPASTLDEVFAIHADAHGKFTKFLEGATPGQWEEILPLGFREIKASRRKMLTQALMHSIHHRAQLATFLRQNGFRQDWVHDIILSPAMA